MDPCFLIHFCVQKRCAAGSERWQGSCFLDARDDVASKAILEALPSPTNFSAERCDQRHTWRRDTRALGSLSHNLQVEGPKRLSKRPWRRMACHASLWIPGRRCDASGQNLSGALLTERNTYWSQRCAPTAGTHRHRLATGRAATQISYS